MSTPTIPEPEAPERDAVAEMKARMIADGWTDERVKAHNDAIYAFRQKYPRHHAAIRDRQDGVLLPVPILVAVALDYTELVNIVRALPAEEQEQLAIEFLRPAGQALGYAVTHRM